ncbi:MAG: nitrogen fixation protein NifD [Elusimicrobia bacterium RIFCSPLOWO2_02_FULL_39_32]|nr:MAG: nitrogen fixation protein NifD [Elusimicrobia bacterium RIFCSPHIGHO2_02_FULL_39_36]OGR91930.1 MAG: nitrogen fixation protein NifD [Elusimicrobia bacterium RIFCSPLOWO2_02_FULL_39_32]OGR98777.1 MAG: nitrogen fixation protein NifD [Elusimicrobia bacterium RIFCSPLOWO2_12_FULL_39_28]
MKMIRAIIRPEKEEDVIKGLELAGCPSLTKMDVFGRGKQKGIQVGNAVYDELAKTMIMVVVEDSMVEKASASIRETCKTGNFGDGKIFVSPVESVVTIRTGKLGI